MNVEGWPFFVLQMYTSVISEHVIKLSHMMISFVTFVLQLIVVAFESYYFGQ